MIVIVVSGFTGPTRFCQPGCMAVPVLGSAAREWVAAQPGHAHSRQYRKPCRVAWYDGFGAWYSFFWAPLGWFIAFLSFSSATPYGQSEVSSSWFPVACWRSWNGCFSLSALRAELHCGSDGSAFSSSQSASRFLLCCLPLYAALRWAS